MTKISDIFNSKRLKVIDKNIATLNDQISELNKSRIALLKSQLVPCPYCEKNHSVGVLHVIKGMCYHKSYAAYEDSTWEPDGMYYTVCPSCYKMCQFDGLWAVKFLPYFRQCQDGSLQIRKHGDDRGFKRKNMVSVMVESNDWTYGYHEVLVPYESVGKATNGKLYNFGLYRTYL